MRATSGKRPARARGPGAGDSRAAIFGAAAKAFAARGFDGAGVDEIAAAAGVNKAMLYYHFKSKRGLYLAVLADMFGAVAADVSAIPASDATPRARLEHFVDAIARACEARPHFPAIWLRELADEGRHLDPSIVPTISGILGALSRILEGGRRAGAFGPAHPLLVHFGIIGPLLVFLASAPARARLLENAPFDIAPLTTADALAHIRAATVATVLARQPGESR